jgi:nitrous oxide reductase
MKNDIEASSASDARLSRRALFGSTLAVGAAIAVPLGSAEAVASASAADRRPHIAEDEFECVLDLVEMGLM